MSASSRASSSLRPLPLANLQPVTTRVTHTPRAIPSFLPTSTTLDRAQRQRYSTIRSFFGSLPARPPQTSTARHHLCQSVPRHALRIGRGAASSFSTTPKPFAVRRPENDQADHPTSVPSAAPPKPQQPGSDDTARPKAELSVQAKDRSLEINHGLFHNYPRALRELALRAMPSSNNSQVGHGVTPPPSEEHAFTTPSHHQRPSDQDGPGSSNHQHHHHHQAWSRPSKEDLLRIAHGFWTRMRIRFKWFTIRGFRRFNADDISAFFTLGGVGTAIWIIVGTTGFFSVVFAALNALNLQEWIARRIADYLTYQTGVTVVFESAIVPKWKESRISFKNVFISRRAHSDAEALRLERSRGTAAASDDDGFIHDRRNVRRVRRRTGITAGQGMSWEGTHYEEEEEVAPPMSDEARGEDEGEDVDTNFTMFDLSVDSIDVTLSLSRWLDGKGLVEDAVVKGVRGIVDRRNVFWDPDQPYDPRSARRKASPGDFHLESLQVEDFLVTVYQPNDFRPFNFSVFSARIPRLRKQWLFYDLLSADAITGQVDGCLFSLHKPQTMGRTVERERELAHSRWRTLSRMRIDGVNIDHIQNQSELTGPVSWILSGKFDVVADIKFPRDLNDDMDINMIIAEIVDNLSAAVSGDARADQDDDDRPIPGQHRLSGPAIEAPVTTVGPTASRVKEEKDAAEARDKAKGLTAVVSTAEKVVSDQELEFLDIEEDDGEGHYEEEELEEEDHETERDHGQGKEPPKGTVSKRTSQDELAIPPPSVVIDMDVRFKDVKAAVPLFTKDLSYSTYAFVRPIVAFMNANKTLIPVHCRIVMDLSEFDGSLDLAQTGLLPVVSDKIYEALAHHVSSQNANQQRLRTVSIWSLQVTANAALNLVTLLRDSLARNRGGQA
ncbi:hypothetical protein IE53DRAFT_383959 [Violaceomyces palustris]|uniref:Uncharacterized protein n=1 Tax=Violaceomyces palustris TaxID=1673888 RepID=A0ACD0P5Y2_9BASI|nr:hypothetical protein IE53DRAFT_383959 [Violaceomyces palustris]